MARVLLGRDQAISIDGVVLAGTREFDVSFDMQEADATSWEHPLKSTIVLSQATTLRMLIYWSEAFEKVLSKMNKHPPQAVQLQINSETSAHFLPTNVRVGFPIDGIVTWDCTFKSWNFNE